MNGMTVKVGTNVIVAPSVPNCPEPLNPECRVKEHADRPFLGPS
jgi:hypothetical protein